jgi:putative addiction module component (TIGR02574 family)
MPVDASEILTLPLKERIALAEKLWDSIEEESYENTAIDIEFAKERFELHLKEPDISYSVDQLKNYFKDRYGL